MSDHNSDRRREQASDIEAITTSRFKPNSNQGSDENEDEEETNPMPVNPPKKIKTTSILKNSSGRIPKPRAITHTSRLQTFQQNENYENEDFEENDGNNTDDDSQNEIDEENEKFPLSHQQFYNKNGQTQKTVKIITRHEKSIGGSGQKGVFMSNSAPQQFPASKFTKYSASGSGYEMSKKKTN